MRLGRLRQAEIDRRVLVAVSVDEDTQHGAYGFGLMRSAGLGAGLLYPALDRLVSMGLLRLFMEKPNGERPPRTMYALTATGKAALDQ